MAAPKMKTSFRFMMNTKILNQLTLVMQRDQTRVRLELETITVCAGAGYLWLQVSYLIAITSSTFF